jgi:ABC-type sugar transport system substrate-binding protein
MEEAPMMRRTIGLLITLALGFLVAPLAANAQPAEKVPRIGVIMQGVPPSASGMVPRLPNRR